MRERARLRRADELERVAARLSELGAASLAAVNTAGAMDPFLAAQRNLRTALGLCSACGGLSHAKKQAAEGTTPTEVNRTMEDAVAQLRSTLDAAA